MNCGTKNPTGEPFGPPTNRCAWWEPRGEHANYPREQLYRDALKGAVHHSSDSSFQEPAEECHADAADLLAVIEEEVGREAVGVECLLNLALLVDVDLDEAGAAGELVGQGLDDRQLPDTGPSPVGVEIDENDPFALREVPEGGLGHKLLHGASGVCGGA